MTIIKFLIRFYQKVVLDSKFSWRTEEKKKCLGLKKMHMMYDIIFAFSRDTKHSQNALNCHVRLSDFA